MDLRGHVDYHARKTLKEANLTVRVHDKLLVCGLEAASERMLNN